ncbi:MAG: response regulator [Candidatus Curtissbacteria bacterium]
MANKNSENFPLEEIEPKTHLTILAAEDDALLRSILKIIFNGILDEGDTYQSFENGTELLSALELNPDTNVIMVDHNLGDRGKTGIDVIKEVKSQNPNIIGVLYSSKEREDLEGEDISGIDLIVAKNKVKERQYLREVIDEIREKLKKSRSL